MLRAVAYAGFFQGGGGGGGLKLGPTFPNDSGKFENRAGQKVAQWGGKRTLFFFFLVSNFENLTFCSVGGGGG